MADRDRDISDELLAELLAGNGLRPDITQRLAVNLQKERQESARLGKAVLAMRALIVEFVNKHNVPTTANDLVVSETRKIRPGERVGESTSELLERTYHSPLEGPNLTSPLIWLQNIFTWMEKR